MAITSKTWFRQQPPVAAAFARAHLFPIPLGLTAWAGTSSAALCMRCAPRSLSPLPPWWGGSLVFGISLGLVAGYFGRFLDTVIMRVGEVTVSFPEIFLLIILVSTVKPPMTDWARGLENTLGVEIVRLGVVDYLAIAMAFSIIHWYGMARLVRGQVLQAREHQYVEAARSIGVSTPRMLFRHVLPNVMGPIIVVVSASLAGFALSEVFLTWLGIGIQPPTPSLGLMLFENGNISVLRTNPHMLLIPGATLAVLLFSFNLLGDAVADAFNPRAR